MDFFCTCGRGTEIFVIEEVCRKLNIDHEKVIIYYLYNRHFCIEHKLEVHHQHLLNMCTATTPAVHN